MLKNVKTVLSTSLVYGLGNVASKFIAFFLLPIITHYLSPAQFGVFETFNVILFLLTTLSLLGFDSAMGRFYYDTEDQRHRQTVISTASVAVCITSIIVSLITWFLADKVGSLIVESSQYRLILRVTIASIFLSAFNTIILSVFQTRRLPVHYSLITLLRFLLLYGLSICFLIWGYGVFGVMLSQFLAYGVVMVVGFVMLHKDIRLALPIRLTLKMVKFGWPVAMAGIAVWILNSSDRFFLLKFSTLSELGLYSIGFRFASIVGMAVTGFQLAWPQFAFSVASQENSAYTYARMLTYYAFVAILLVLGVTLFSPELIRLLTTKEYGGAETVIPLLSCSFLLYGAYYIFATTVSVAKKTFSIFPITLVAVAVSAGSNFFLVPKFGMIGAALTSVLSYLVLAVLMYLVAKRRMYIRYEWFRIAKLVGVGGTLLLIGRLFRVQPIWLALSIKTMIILCFFCFLAILDFFNYNEKNTIVRIFSKLTFRLRK